MRANRATNVASLSVDGVSRPRHESAARCYGALLAAAAIGVKFFAHASSERSARRAGAGRRDVVPGAVRDRRACALRAAVFLRLYGARLRLVARPGDLRERAQQAPGGTAVRFSGRVDGGPLRPTPSDGGRNS